MIKISMTEAKANFSRYIESVERGETVTICRGNVPVAVIHPVPEPPRGRRPVGIDRGMEIPSSFFDPLPEDLLAAFNQS